MRLVQVWQCAAASAARWGAAPHPFAILRLISQSQLPTYPCRLSGYIFDEKVAIARTYLEPQASRC